MWRGIRSDNYRNVMMQWWISWRPFIYKNKENVRSLSGNLSHFYNLIFAGKRIRLSFYIGYFFPFICLQLLFIDAQTHFVFNQNYAHQSVNGGCTGRFILVFAIIAFNIIIYCAKKQLSTLPVDISKSIIRNESVS
jgi:hypothetical protein